MKVILLCLFIKFIIVFSDSQYTSPVKVIWSQQSEQIDNETSLYNINKNYLTEDQQEEIKHNVSTKSLNEDTSSVINENINDFKNPPNVDIASYNIINRNLTLEGYCPDIYLDTVQLIRKYGYTPESHIVQTDDGYLLTMHRIPHGREGEPGSSGKYPILLQHGLLSSSADFVVTGPKKGLAYILADAGYDVWLGNFRGNTYSRAHVSLSTSDPSFWNFSFHEMGVYDLPAMIDYINDIKNSKKTFYIGHSMGNTALFVLLSTRPEYNKKLTSAFCLGPAAYMTDIKSPIKLLAPFTDNLVWIMKHLGIRMFFPQSKLMKWLATDCGKNNFDERICMNILFLFAGFDSNQFNKAALPAILGHSPAGTSTKTIVHFTQEIRDNGKFQQFDYGSKRNVIIYGQETPPEYSISKITLPISFFYGDNDWLVGVSNVKKLFKQLKNGKILYEVPYKKFNHLDFLWAVDAPTLVYKKLIKLMKQNKK